MEWQEVILKTKSEIFPQDILDEIMKDFLKPVNISPDQFYCNYLKLIGPKDFIDYMSRSKDFTPSNSLKFISLINLISIFPLWFYVACPDVMHWLHEKQREAAKNNKLADFFMNNTKLLKILPSDDFLDMANNQIYFNRQYRPKYLSNLTMTYKEDTGKALECLEV